MTIEIDDVITFLGHAFEKEHAITLMHYDLALDSASKEAFNEAKQAEAFVSEVSARTQTVPCLPYVALPYTDNCWLPDLEARRANREKQRRRNVLKVSRYDHATYDAVFRCLVSDAMPARPKDFLDSRWDVVVKDGAMILANTNQKPCYACKGLSGVNNTSCSDCDRIAASWRPPAKWEEHRQYEAATFRGFTSAPTHDLGELTQPTEIRRLPYKGRPFKDLYNADV